MGTSATPTIVGDAQAILNAAASENLTLKALGGIAVYLRANDRARDALARELLDIDFATSRSETSNLTPLFERHGLVPDTRFNALHGARRLMFLDQVSERHIDVFVERFEMCHVVPFDGRLEVDELTLPLAELLLTKLQIIHLNRKDVIDTCSLLLSHPVGANDQNTLNAQRVAELCADDWGLYHTLELNLTRVAERLSEVPLTAGERAVIADRLGELRAAMDERPKSRRWRMRARVGERKRWYEEPEEVDRSGLQEEAE